MVQEWMWDEENVITGVSALPGHRLRIELRTGSVLELHMANRLDSARYYPLRDEELMRSVTTDGNSKRLRFAVQRRAGGDGSRGRMGRRLRRAQPGL